MEYRSIFSVRDGNLRVNRYICWKYDICQSVGNQLNFINASKKFNLFLFGLILTIITLLSSIVAALFIPVISDLEYKNYLLPLIYVLIILSSQIQAWSGHFGAQAMTPSNSAPEETRWRSAPRACPWSSGTTVGPADSPPRSRSAVAAIRSGGRSVSSSIAYVNVLMD